MRHGQPEMSMGQRNMILRANSHRHEWSGAGALSIKTFFGGRAYYKTDTGGHYAVDDRVYLLLNQGQHYTIIVDLETPLESFCVFFAEQLAADVLHSFQKSTAHLLDEPRPTVTPATFFDRTYPHDDLVSPALLRLRATLAEHQPEQGWLDEQFHNLMARLLQAQQYLAPEIERLTAARPATRIELYRRLHLARDYADAMIDTPLTLAGLAQVAGLSPNHLLRTFRQLFGQTPYQYITARRIELARRLLAETEQPVTEICNTIGFESLGSFSWLFRRRMGVSPLDYRRHPA